MGHVELLPPPRAGTNIPGILSLSAVSAECPFPHLPESLTHLPHKVALGKVPRASIGFPSVFAFSEGA